MNRLKNTEHLVRDSVLKIFNKEFLTFLFFLVLSGIFWLMMTLNETYEKEVPVRVRLTGVPKNVVITQDVNDTIMVTMRDKGFYIAAYMLKGYLAPVSFDFDDYANDKVEKGVIPAADIVKAVSLQLQGSTKVVSLKPDHLEFYYNYGLSKTVPVRLSGVIRPSASCYLAKVQFWPDHVTVYASQHILDSIKYVTTQDLRITNFNDTVLRRVPLMKIRGAKIMPATVRLGLFPDILTEESMEVPIEAINMPPDKVFRPFPNKIRVRFTVGASQFRHIKPEHFVVVADYNEIARQPSSKCNLYLKSAPKEVRHPTLEFNQVDYLIEQE